MRPVSNAFQRYLYENNRGYLNRVEITLSDDTPLTIDNTRLWAGGVQIDDNVSDQSSFTSLGSAIINSLQIIINNIYDEYSIYIFEGAKVVPYIGLLIGTSVEEIKLGEFTVDSATYNGALITLNCLDNMAKFDKPYSSSTLIYPATLQQIVSDACTNCGVLLESTTFSNYTFSVATRPTDEALTYREVIAYAATLAGCFAKCNSNGKLELNWFDVAAIQAFSDGIEGGIFDADTPYSTGDSVNGGVFNPWETGDVADGGTFSEFPDLHFLTSLKSQDVGIDDIVITGVQIQLKIEDGTSADIETSLFGNEGYLIKIENNPFITVDNVQAVGTYLQNKIVGLTFRNATVSHLNDPSIEAGDVAIIRDRKNNLYPILITNTEFTVDSYQRTISAAEPPLRHEAVRFNQATKSFVESKEMVKNEATLRKQLQDNLTQALNAKPGMYETRIQEAGGGYTYYLHDKPNLSESVAVIKITNEAVGVTANYQAQTPTWYGLTVDGNFIANIMSVIGIDFDWGTGGTLTLGGNGNGNGTLTILNAQNQTIGYWDNTGINASAGFIGNWQIVNGVLASYVGNLEVASLDTEFGIRYYDHNGMGWINIDPGGRIHARSMSTYYPIYWCLDDENTHDESNVYPGYFTVENSNPNTNNYDGKWGQYNSELGMWLNGLDVIPVVVELDGWTKGASIAFKSLKNGALLTNYYNGTTYNLIRNHNNGDISVSASGGVLGLGYENTTSLNFLNGKATLNTNGNFSTIYSDGAAWIRACNSTTGNRIYMQANTDGTVDLGSAGANNTLYTIVKRANNANDITAYGKWTFNTGIVGNNNVYGKPIISNGTDTYRVALMTASGSTALQISAQWGSSSYSVKNATVSSSDIRLKEHIEDCTLLALPVVNSIRIREFDWTDGRHQRIGVVADELEELDSKFAVGGGYEEDGSMNVKSVDTFYLVGYLVKAVQELSAEVEKLKGANK